MVNQLSILSQGPARPVNVQAALASIPSERMAPFLQACNGNTSEACNFYLWNIRASSALWGSFHLLEITLRNAIHAELTNRYQQEDWWTTGTSLHIKDLDYVAIAISNVERLQSNPTAGHVVAELNFSFWVFLLGKKYHASLWVGCLEKSFPGFQGTRHNLYMELDRLRKLRNRIAHHEPIHARNLSLDHDSIARNVGFINPDLEFLIRGNSKLPSVVAQKAQFLSGQIAPEI